MATERFVGGSLGLLEQ